MLIGSKNENPKLTPEQLGQAYAQPVVIVGQNGLGQPVQQVIGGMSIRLEIATRIVGSIDWIDLVKDETIVKRAFGLADELLKQSLENGNV
jgi:pantoate kinase